MPYNIRVDVALPKVRADSKKQVFETLAAEISRVTGAPPRALADALAAKEKYDSSATGNGVAITHLKLQGLDRRIVALATLQNAVDFDAPDDAPVDLVCLLLSPESDGPLHLHSLSRISRTLKNEDLCNKLRGTSNPEVISTLFANPEGWLVAA